MEKQVKTLTCGVAEVTLSSSNKEKNLSNLDSSSSSINTSIGTNVTPIQIVQFIHQPVKDFFVVEGGLSILSDSTPTIVHERLTFD